MLILGYSLLLMLALVVSAPWWLLRMATTSRYREGLKQRLGAVPKRLLFRSKNRRIVWLHAVSVGEVLAASRLVVELEKALGSGWIIVISTTTRTGQALAQERFTPDRVFYMPLDFARPVRKYLKALRPRALILMESELWPRMLHECRWFRVPVAVVNARVSDRSFARGRRVRWIWGRTLRKVSLWLAQSDEDARRLVAMGARAPKVHATGNLKYDILAPRQIQVAELLREGAAGRMILVAGSTVDGKPATEEEIFLRDGMGPVWKEFPEALLVLAPRHPERFDEVARLASAVAPTIRATELMRRHSTTPLTERIVVLDTIGDLAAVYGLAAVAFVGGSLVKRGGHNPLEPAQFAVPVMMGPSFENFRDVVARMQAAQGIAIVKRGQSCGNVLLWLLRERAESQAMGERALAVFEEQQGATARAVEEIVTMIQLRRRRKKP